MSENIFSEHVQKALVWIAQMRVSRDLEKDPHILDALRVVLHQLRDNLPIIETSDHSSELPLIIRGLYFEEWQPSHVSIRELQSMDFVNSIRDNLERYMKRPFNDIEVRQIINAVFKILETHIDANEVNKPYFVLPAGARGFIP